MEKKEFVRYPLNATFELTARCNLRCRMCMIRLNSKQLAELGGRERTTDEWIGMAKEIQEAGAIGLLLTGGEPLLRPDFARIYQAIAEMGFMLTLYTNATLVTPQVMEVLRRYPPHRLGITVYGASSDTYGKVTGDPDAYYRMLEGVNQLRTLPTKITIRTTLIRDNLEDLETITQWVIALGHGVDFSVSRVVTKPVRGCTSEVASCRLTPEENVNMLRKRTMEYVVEPFRKIATGQSNSIKQHNAEDKENQIDHRRRKKPTLYGCEAGMSSYTITWDGKLIGCQMLGDCCTYPFESGFAKAWEEFPRQVKLPPMPEACVACKISCSACPATRLAETGYLDGVPEYLCRESKLAKEMEDNLVEELKKYLKKGENRCVKV